MGFYNKKQFSTKLVKRVSLFIVILAPLTTSAQSYGNFPYEESFKSTVQPSEVSIPAVSSGSNSATFTDAGLRLTSNVQSQFGAVFVNSLQFRSINGLRVEFEYMVYGGGAERADGISLFLMDAAVTNPVIGAKGAGLGYSFNRATNSYASVRAPGLTGAYLGIGIDTYGNFKSVRFQPDSRVNGIEGGNLLGGSNVTLRGAKGMPDLAYPGANFEGYSGYPVLITQSTENPSLNSVIDVTDGSYSAFTSSIATNETFTLRGGGPFDDEDVTNSAYRKAIVELYPWVDALTGATLGKIIIVKIQIGTDVITVIDNFQYPEALTYIENSYSNQSIGDNTTTAGAQRSVSKSLNTSTPDFLRVGFAASTGFYFDNHFIKNLRITLPSSAIAVNDNATVAMNSMVDIYPLANDLGFTGTISPSQVGSATHLVPAFFRFKDDDNNPVTGNTYTNTNGTWVYDATLSKVTFTPNANFLGTASVRYDIKGGVGGEQPYVDEAYRSLPATITVLVVPPQGIVTNRMLQPLIR